MEITSSQQLKEASQKKSPFLKIEQGKTRVRIVSSIYGTREHRVDIKGQSRAIICPVQMEAWDAEAEDRQVNRAIKCPVCENGSEKEKKYKNQFMAIAVTDQGAIGVLKKGATVFQAITDLKEEGYDLSKTFIAITRTGEGLDTEYSVIPTKDERELTDDEKSAVMAFIAEFNPSARSKPMSYENIERKLKGEDLIFEEEEG